MGVVFVFSVALARALPSPFRAIYTLLSSILELFSHHFEPLKVILKPQKAICKPFGEINRPHLPLQGSLRHGIHRELRPCDPDAVRLVPHLPRGPLLWPSLAFSRRLHAFIAFFILFLCFGHTFHGRFRHGRLHLEPRGSRNPLSRVENACLDVLLHPAKTFSDLPVFKTSSSTSWATRFQCIWSPNPPNSRSDHCRGAAAWHPPWSSPAALGP